MTPAADDSAPQSGRPPDVAAQLPCGSGLGAFVEGVKKFADAGFTDVAPVQIGGEHQDPFFDWAAKELLPALHEL